MLLQTAQTLFKRRLTSAIALPLVLLLLLSGVSIWQITRLLSAMQWVDHTDQVIARANRVQRLLLDMESGVRGYLLSGEQDFLEPYQQGTSQINPALDQLEHLVSDNPSQVQRVAELRLRQAEWNRYVPQKLTLRQHGVTEPGSVLRISKQLMDTLRSQTAAFIATEEQLRDQRNQAVQQTTRFVIITSIGLAVVVGSILTYVIRRQLLNVSQSYEDALKAAQEQTEKAQRSAQRLACLHDIDRAIIAAQSIETLVREALSGLRELVNCQQAFVVLLTSETETARVLAGDAHRDLSPPEGTSLAVADLAPSDVLQQGKLWYVEDVATLEPRPLVLERLLAAGFHSCMTIPLHDQDNLIGGLSLAETRPKAFSAVSQTVAREVAAQLAIAIQQFELRGQLQRYAAELEQRVAERTTKLEEINNELEAFTYSVSHDLRAPLRTMQGFAQALLEDYGDHLDSIGQDYTHYIVEGALQMDTLIAELLAYSRLSRREIQLQPVDLDAVVQEALNQLTAQLQERQVQVNVEAPLLQVMAHRQTLIQVIINLLSNAIKFVEPDVRPRVRVWAQEQQDWIRLWVMDNGIGIAPEHQERIFRVFERLHGVESYPGTGIGLAIVYKGLERMGGRVGVESQADLGSRFWIDLPAATQQ
jgi:signal transduction histidine kinase